MPEGHTIHRAAREQRPGLAGERVRARSPQGRFAQGAAVLDGRRCLGIEAYGKHLLYAFEDEPALHVHLGLFGRIRVLEPGAEPPGEVRLRLETSRMVVGINGPTACELLEPPAVDALLGRLGPDPLRCDADPERAWARMSRSRAPLGLLLMDQSVIAGAGNIYRTELLWRARLHPLSPGRSLERPLFEALWEDARRLLELGVETGAIVTRDGLKRVPRTFRARVNVFKKTRCPRCASPVQRLELAGRKAFACETCAPPP
mgnify:CR=1 FL=1